MRASRHRRVLAIGDIHGCSQAFQALLAVVQPGSEDLIVTLGDYVDRGPNSFAVIETLVGLLKTHHLVPLRGNHDQMMMEARLGDIGVIDWMACGGRATLASYFVRGETDESTDGPDSLEQVYEWLVDVPELHWEFLERICLDSFEIDTHFFVHANAYPDLPLCDQPTYMLRWERLDKTAPHMSGKTMICGHTAQRSGWPLNLGHAICVDTWVYGAGWLTCLDVLTGRFWQANQLGETRTRHLDEVPSQAITTEDLA